MAFSMVASPAAVPSTTSCAAQLYNIPVQEAACAMPAGGNNSDIMASCCSPASVVSYYDDCGLFCLSYGQPISELTNCLFQAGAGWSDVFCNDKQSASATDTSPKLAASAQAHVVATGSSGNDGSPPSFADSSSPPTESTSAASNIKPISSVVTVPLVILISTHLAGLYT